MKTSTIEVLTKGNSKDPQRKSRIKIISLFTVLFLYFSSGISFAHCDTMEGPLIGDARKAISQNNVNIALKWVPVSNEDDIIKAFDLMMKVRELSDDAKLLSEMYFFETLVRVHRAGEGVPYTGIKPKGSPIDEKVKAADKSIEIGNLSPLNGFVEKEDFPELTKRFNKVMMLKNFDNNNVKAGREYVEAYVQFFKYAEVESDDHESHVNKTVSHSDCNPSNHIHKK